MKHPHTALLEKLYSDLSRGDLPQALAACADSMTFQVPGKSLIAGKHGKADFPGAYAARLQELSDGTLKREVHDILASDQHATVLLTGRLVRGGKSIEYRAVHVWRFEGGKAVAGYEYPRDLYQFDQIWG